MARLFWQMMVTLDGFAEGEDGNIDWHTVDEGFTEYALGMLSSIDGIVLGRRTYELFAGYWPGSNDPEGPLMNAVPKYVASTTMGDPGWANTTVLRDPVAALRDLKAVCRRDLGVFGSARLATSLFHAGLIDEVRVMVNPVVLGAGKPMFAVAGQQRQLRFASLQTFRSGLVLLTYDV
ncbi:MAG: dihydrofolate reductase family protein [Dehalococcoidia bacterium]|nr:dihydrofolate reductase family protein [Dehalococcoidia bacterium]